MFKPLVSVLITAFNSEATILATVRRLENQTYSNFELVVVEDGSFDQTSQILDSIELQSGTLKVLKPGRVGRAKALNLGLYACEGKYIAINDSDDWSLPSRFEKQVSFMEKNPEYVLVGSRMRIHHTFTGQTIDYRDDWRPIGDKDIRRFFFRGQPIQHSSCMIRKCALLEAGGYNERISFLLDRDIFLKLARVGKMRNLKDELISLGRGDSQYFKNRYSGAERCFQDYKYRLTAIKQFKGGKALFIKVLLTGVFVYTRKKINHINR